jgi:hypothetical protein
VLELVALDKKAVPRGNRSAGYQLVSKVTKQPYVI